MTIRFTTTADPLRKCKILVYSLAGLGKTTLCGTASKPVIVSSERGLLSLQHLDIPVMEISSMSDCYDAYNILNGPQGARFDTVCLDSITDIAKTILGVFKKEKKDARQAYGDLADEVGGLIRGFRDLDKDVYFTAQLERITDEYSGITTYGPSMPGKQLLRDLPYYFDEVLCLREFKDAEGGVFRALQTQPDLQYIAKDRSGRLDQLEYPDLTHVFNKMRGIV